MLFLVFSESKRRPTGLYKGTAKNQCGVFATQVVDPGLTDYDVLGIRNSKDFTTDILIVMPLRGTGSLGESTKPLCMQ